MRIKFINNFRILNSRPFDQNGLKFIIKIKYDPFRNEFGLIYPGEFLLDFG